MKQIAALKLQDKALVITIEALARLLAPESVVLSASKKLSPEEQEAVNVASRLLQPGDIVLTQTPGNTYEVLRTFAGHFYDHVAVVIETGKCIQIGPPYARIVPITHFLTIKRKPAVLRPKLSEEEREVYIANLKKIVGKAYDYLKVMTFWMSLSLYERIGYVFPLSPSTSNKVICTEAIIYCLPNAERILNKHKSSLDYGRLNAVSIGDIMTLYERDELTFVKLPFPYTIYKVYTAPSYQLLFKLAKRQAFNFRLLSKGWTIVKLLQMLNEKKHKPAIFVLWLLQLYMELMGVPYFAEMRMLMSVFTRFWPKL